MRFDLDICAMLRTRKVKVATAESCTGGRVAAELTAEAGASKYFVGGVVAYSNAVKISVLGVSRQTLEAHGAVSPEVAQEMALGVKRLTGADYAIATTGIAGPGGGMPDKPVGTLWMAVAGPGDTITVQRAFLPGSRSEIMALATDSALTFLKKIITDNS
ncbi:MAG: CinA family protein [Alistipes sp.]|jgi:nicotinamide-nucleotide amidase|nr:CinA family protein [Alistipes sp.]